MDWRGTKAQLWAPVPACPLWGRSPYIPAPAAPTKEDESGLTLLLSPRSVDKVYMHVCVWACECAHQPVCRGKGRVPEPHLSASVTKASRP